MSEWNTENGKLIYKCTVPANSSATLYLPASSISSITESGKNIVSWKGIKEESAKILIPLNAGSYVFEVK